MKRAASCEAVSWEDSHLPNRDIVAIGASAGGVEALVFLAKHLPRDLQATILVTIHLPSLGISPLDAMLARAGGLKASFAEHGRSIDRGQIILAPPGHHLLVEKDKLFLGTGPRENNARPAIDPMFRSVAVSCGHRSIGVILTGAQGDGASGLWALAQAGAMTVVQDPNDAAVADMPQAALDRVMPDHIVPLTAIPRLLSDLVRLPSAAPRPAPEGVRLELEIAKGVRPGMEEMDRLGERSVLTCPDCNGVLWEIKEGNLSRYRCHVGHAYSTESFAWAIDENIRKALATALRTLEERSALFAKLQKEAAGRGQNRLAESWDVRRREFEQQAETIRTEIQRASRVRAGEAVS